MNLKNSIKKDEGWRSRVYKDSKGISSIGWGFNIEDEDLPLEVADLWLDIKLKQHRFELRSFEWFNQLNRDRQNALINMHYNLGHSRFLKFKKMIAAFEQKDYVKAAEEMLDSKWHRKDVGERAERLATMIRGN